MAGGGCADSSCTGSIDMDIVDPNILYCSNWCGMADTVHIQNTSWHNVVGDSGMHYAAVLVI